MKYITIALLTMAVIFNTQAQVNYDTSMNGAVTEAPEAWFAGAGLGALNNLSADDPAYQFFGGRLWSWNPYTSLKATTEAAFDFNGSWLIDALVGANFYPIRTRYTPYIGGGIGVGYARRDLTEDDLLGLDLSGVFGVLLYRGAPLEIQLEAGANWLFREAQGNDFPATFTFRVGAHF